MAHYDPSPWSLAMPYKTHLIPGLGKPVMQPATGNGLPKWLTLLALPGIHRDLA